MDGEERRAIQSVEKLRLLTVEDGPHPSELYSHQLSALSSQSDTCELNADSREPTV